MKSTIFKLAFGIVFGLLTFVLPLPVGGEKLFAEVGRAALLLGILFGLFVIIGSVEKVSILQWILRRKRGRRFVTAMGVLTIFSVGTYLVVRRAINVPEGGVLYVEMLLYALSNLLIAFFLSATGGGLVMKFMRK